MTSLHTLSTLNGTGFLVSEISRKNTHTHKKNNNISTRKNNRLVDTINIEALTTIYTLAYQPTAYPLVMQLLNTYTHTEIHTNSKI